jgi:hypothetical protein
VRRRLGLGALGGVLAGALLGALLISGLNSFLADASRA